jgi:type VI secretion system protein ImpF
VAKYEYEVRVTPPLLDRLIDLNPGGSREVPASRDESVRLFKHSVQRDLENLLNTRNPVWDLASDFVEAKASGLAYGMPDFTSLNILSPSDRERLSRQLERVIGVFEPRLRDVKVLLHDSKGGGEEAETQVERSLRFRVEARLVLEPVIEPISFDMVMEMDKLEYRVEESSR